MEDFDELLKIQQRMAGRIIEENNQDNKLEMMDIINNVLGRKNKIQTEAVILEAEKNGIANDDALRILDDLADLGFITYKEEGFVERG